jgi:hypothetical protein
MRRDYCNIVGYYSTISALVAKQSKEEVLAAWLLGSWVRIPLGACKFVFLYCIVQCRYRPLHQADYSSKGVLPHV